MLELKNITKEYPAGDSTVQALKGISLQFRQSEFVSFRLRKDHYAEYHRWTGPVYQR